MAGFFDLGCLFKKTARAAESRERGFRGRRHTDLRPDRLARPASPGHSPADGERVHEQQAAARLAAPMGRLRRRRPLTACVRRLDTPPPSWTAGGFRRTPRSTSSPSRRRPTPSPTGGSPATTSGCSSTRSATSSADSRAGRAPWGVDGSRTAKWRMGERSWGESRATARCASRGCRTRPMTRGLYCCGCGGSRASAEDVLVRGVAARAARTSVFERDPAPEDAVRGLRVSRTASRPGAAGAPAAGG